VFGAYAEWRFFVYWGVWLAILLLPRFLHRGQRQFERWEIYEAYPQHKKALRLHRWLVNGFSILSMLAMIAVLFIPGSTEGARLELAAVVWGALLLVDAGLPRFTGVRPISARPPRFVIEEGRTWRLKLQLYVALGYFLMVAAVLVLRAT